ncbi:MAG: hypothetical protein AAGF12_33200 [Myxococcota bacterium]
MLCCLSIVSPLFEALELGPDVIPVAETAGKSGALGIEGYLQSEQPVRMPDDQSDVISGRLLVSAGESRRVVVNEDPLRYGSRYAPVYVLVDFDASAPTAYLTDGTHRIEIANVEALEGFDDRSARSTIEYAPTDSPRTRGPALAVEYRERRYPLPTPHDGELRTRVERSTVPFNQLVTVFGTLEGNVLRPSPRTQRLRVSRGGTADRALPPGFIFFAIPVGLLFIALGAAIAIFFTIRIGKEAAQGLIGER